MFAMSAKNLGTSIPITFQSYEALANSGPNYTIWEALYATIHPELFEEIRSDGLIRQLFIGGDHGCNSQIAHVFAEARRLYPGRPVSCVLSIGSGNARAIPIPVKGPTVDNEQIAMVTRLLGIPGAFHRFDLDKGMQCMPADSCEGLNEVTEHTRAYIGRGDINQRIDQVVQVIKEISLAYMGKH